MPSKTQNAKFEVTYPRRRVKHRHSDKLVTNQDDAKATDINTIVAQHIKYGTTPNIPLKDGIYGDFSRPDDLHSVREYVYEAEQTFNNLPSAVRSLCENDWTQFPDRVNDPEQRALFEAAGLTFNNPPTTTPDPEEPPSPATGEAGSDPQEEQP